MAPTLTIHVQPPSALSKNETMTPSPKVRAELDATSSMPHPSEMLATADLYRYYSSSSSATTGSEYVKRFRGSGPTVVRRVAGKVYLESEFETVRVAEAGRYFLKVSVTGLDGSEGGLVLGVVNTEGFEVY